MGKILAHIAGRIATFLAFDGDEFYNVLCDSEGHLQIDVLESALPSGAATATNQATIITAVQSLQNLVGALHDVGLDEIDVNVDSSVLPTDAATETTLDEVNKRLGDETSPASGSANAQLADIVARIGALTTPDAGSTNKLLTDALTALQLIDDLYGALASQATDRLIVRGEDQLFSFESVLALTRSGNPSGANGYFESLAPGANEVWVVTTIAANDISRVLTDMIFYNHHDTASVALKGELRAIAADEWVHWSGHTYLDQSDTIRVVFKGSQAADTVIVVITGYRMTLET